MLKISRTTVFAGLLILAVSATGQAGPGGNCPDTQAPRISFIEYPSVENPLLPPELQTEITIKAKLKLPQACNRKNRGRHQRPGMPAVVIVHGSGGVDFRGDFYARALNEGGIATLEIDLWESRGVTGVADRPALPIITVPDTFGGLAYLASREEIDPDRIGMLGFSWGGVMSLATAEQSYAGWFGNGRAFAAHVANYPVCYGANDATILARFGIDPLLAGTQFLSLTGAPILIQIGTEDDYDNGPEPCLNMAQELLDPADRQLVDVAVYDGAYHAWDRLQVPSIAVDPFADEGRFLKGLIPAPPIVEVIPDVEHAYASRDAAVRFFQENL